MQYRSILIVTLFSVFCGGCSFFQAKAEPNPEPIDTAKAETVFYALHDCEQAFAGTAGRVCGYNRVQLTNAMGKGESMLVTFEANELDSTDKTLTLVVKQFGEVDRYYVSLGSKTVLAKAAGEGTKRPLNYEESRLVNAIIGNFVVEFNLDKPHVGSDFQQASARSPHDRALLIYPLG